MKLPPNNNAENKCSRPLQRKHGMNRGRQLHRKLGIRLKQGSTFTVTPERFLQRTPDVSPSMFRRS